MRRLVVLTLALCSWGLSTAASSPSVCRAYMSDGSFFPFLYGYPPVELADETDAYTHGVLGDTVEYRTIRLAVPDISTDALSEAFRITLPDDRVFEDIEVRAVPSLAGSWRESGSGGHRLYDLFAVVETDMARGASLALYHVGCHAGTTKIAATPPIGTPFRWLAPAAIEDFDGDGNTDIAYVETPHLRGILKVVTRDGDRLVPVAAPMPGFSNHAIGEDFITSGVRLCRPHPQPVRLRGGLVQTLQPEILVPSLDRDRLLAVRIEDGELVVEDRPEPPTPDGIRAAQICSPEELAQ